MAERRNRGRQRGAVLLLTTAGLLVALTFVGLFVDLGIAFVAKAQLSKALDAGALAAARSTASGSTAMRQTALDIAKANYTIRSADSYVINIDAPWPDTTRVEMTAHNVVPTLFTRITGLTTVSMQARGEAIRYPLDLSLVLDVSGSLGSNGGWDPLKAAAKSFVAAFNEQIDQVGIVSFSTVAAEVMTMRRNFKSKANSTIDDLDIIADTNIDDGLRLGKTQLDGAPKRQMAIKVLVLFTDGRPTAFRDVFDVKNPPDNYDGVVAAYTSGSSVRGLFEPIDGQKVHQFDSKGKPVLVPNLSNSPSQDMPNKLPGNLAVTGDNVRQVGITQAEASANAARAAGYRVYTIGLGSVDGAPEDVPDFGLLRRIANEGGMVDATQPRGIMLAAPAPADLNAAFTQLAARILVRLTH